MDDLRLQRIYFEPCPPLVSLCDEQHEELVPRVFIVLIASSSLVTCFVLLGIL